MVNSFTLCFVCEEGVFHNRVDRIRVQPAMGKAFTVKTKYAICPECGTEVQTMMDTDSNVRNMQKLRGRVDAVGQKFVKV